MDKRSCLLGLADRIEGGGIYDLSDDLVIAFGWEQRMVSWGHVAALKRRDPNGGGWIAPLRPNLKLDDLIIAFRGPNEWRALPALIPPEKPAAAAFLIRHMVEMEQY